MITFTTKIKSMKDFPACGRAKQTLREITKAGKLNQLDLFMDQFCESYYGGGPMTKNQINDLLSYEWQFVFENIGMEDWI